FFVEKSLDMDKVRISFSPDSKSVLVTNPHFDTAQVWRLDNDGVEYGCNLPLQSDIAMTPQFSGDGSHFLCTFEDDTIIEYDVATCSESERIQTGEEVVGGVYYGSTPAVI